MNASRTAAAQESTTASFEALLSAERDGLWRFAARACWDRATAEDCVQEATLIAFRKFDQFTLGTSFRAWVFRILANVIRNANSRTWREQKLRAPSQDLDLVQATEQVPGYAGVLQDPEALLEQVSDEVRRALQLLPETQRAALLLSSVEGLRYREIAQVLDIPIGTVMSHLHRARVRLRQALAQHALQAGWVRTRPPAPSVPPSSP